MLIEVLLLFILLILYLKLKDDSLICLFIIFISFNGFFLSCFHNFVNSNGSIFSYWKELLILVLFIRNYKKIYIKGILWKSFTLICIVLVIYSSISFYNDYPLSKIIIADRGYIFPILLFFVCSSINANTIVQNKIIKTFFILIIISNIFGIVEHFFLHEQLLIFENILNYNQTGDLVANTSSFQIMGIDRMTGITDGGPNMFGIINAMSIVAIISLNIENKKSKLVILAFLLSVFGLMMSFSRAGIALVLLSIVYFLVSKRNFKPLFYILISFLLILIINLFSKDDSFSSVMNSTIEGKEASAADRNQNVYRGFDFIANNLFGCGIGVIDNGEETPQGIQTVFFESSIINIFVELGVIGGIVLLAFYYRIYNMAKKIGKKCTNNISIFVVLITFSSLLVAIASVSPFGIPFSYIWMIFAGLGCNKYYK